MNQAIITSFNGKGQSTYGNSFLKSLTDNLTGELFLFLGIDKTVDVGQVEHILQNQKWLEWNYIHLDECRDLANFKERYAGSREHNGIDPIGRYGIKYDVVKFSNKAFSILEAILKAREAGFDALWWLDADTYVHSPLPADFLASMINRKATINYLGRDHVNGKNRYPETGIVSFDLTKPDLQTFYDAFRHVYVSGEFEKHAEWHDAFLFGDTIKENDISRYSWTGGLQTTHPAINIFWKWFDHRKGPGRKESRSGKHEIIVNTHGHPYWN